jgi:hypothetical protein
MSNWNFKLFWQILYCFVCLSDSPNDPSDVTFACEVWLDYLSLLDYEEKHRYFPIMFWWLLL